MRGVVVVEEVPSRERPRSRHKGRKPSGGNAGEGGRSSKPPRCPPPLPRASVCCPPPVSVPGLFSGGGRVILCTNKHGPVGREVSSPSPGQFWGDPILAVTFPLPWHCVRVPPPPSQRYTASPRLCPGFLRLRGARMTRRGIILVVTGRVECQHLPAAVMTGSG